MEKQILQNTMFDKFNEFLVKKNMFSDEIVNYINNDLQLKMIETEPLKNKQSNKHLQTILLPTVSIYFALIKNGIQEEQAIKCIQEYVLGYYAKQANLLKTLGKIPNFYYLMKIFFPKAMKIYPTEHWETQWIRNDKEEISFNMKSCLYYDTFCKYKCEHLTPIFCGVDDLCYENMSRHVNFVRTKTIGKGNDCCDFRFVRVK